MSAQATIQETEYGYRITFAGFVQQDGAEKLLAAMQSNIRHRPGFSVLVDMRASRAFPAEAQEIVKKAIFFCREAGMERNVVVLDSAIAALQARRLARETGIGDWIRYIDASSSPDWESVALAWLERGIDPDLDSDGAA